VEVGVEIDEDAADEDAAGDELATDVAEGLPEHAASSATASVVPTPDSAERARAW
jgi:hypothetical protein